MLLNEIKNLKSTKKELVKFGLTFGLLVIIFYSLFYYFSNANFYWMLIVSGIFFCASFFFTSLLKPFYKVWMSFAIILNFIVTRIILSILFYFVITPMGFISKLLGKNYLNLELEEKVETYWNFREISVFKKDDYENQF